MADLHILDLLWRFIFSVLHNESGQELHENYINGFSHKILVQGKWDTSGMKMADPYSGATLLMVFLRKNLAQGKWANLDGAAGSLWAKKWCVLVTGSGLKDFFTVKEAKMYMKIILMVYFKKNLFVVVVACYSFIDFLFHYFA